MFNKGTGGRDRTVGMSNKVVVSHQSPSPLCEVDKSRPAHLPQSDEAEKLTPG